MFINIECILDAYNDLCNENGLHSKVEFIDDNNNFLRIKLNSSWLEFANWATPFNSEVQRQVCTAKYFTYKLLRDVIKYPTTKSYLDPGIDERYRKYLNFSSYEEIQRDIVKQFSFPLILKKETGSRGRFVFLCKDYKDVENRVHQIFNQNNKSYDKVLIAQEYIDIYREFRVICFNKKIELLYEKVFDKNKIVDSLSPLHVPGSFAKLIYSRSGINFDPELIDTINKFIKPIFEESNVNYVGLDVAVTEKDDFYLLEMNSRPIFEYFVRDNGKKEIISLYKRILKNYIY